MYLNLHVNVNNKLFQNCIFRTVFTWEKLEIIITAIMIVIYSFGLIFLSRNSTTELFKAALLCNQFILLNVFMKVAIKETPLCDLGSAVLTKPTNRSWKSLPTNYNPSL